MAPPPPRLLLLLQRLPLVRVALRAVPLALLSLWHGISLHSPQPGVGECSEQKQTVSQCTGPAGGRTDGRSFSVLVPKMPLIPFSSKDQNFPGPGLHRPPSYAGVVVLACVLVVGVNVREGSLPSLFFLLLREISSFYYRFRFQTGLNRSKLSICADSAALAGEWRPPPQRLSTSSLPLTGFLKSLRSQIDDLKFQGRLTMDGVCHLEFTPSAPFALLDVGEPVFLATPWPQEAFLPRGSAPGFSWFRMVRLG